jgi:hypothetical protein
MFLGKVDCVSQPELGRRFGVKSYPTLKFFRDNSTREYRDERTLEALLRYGKTMSKAPVVAANTRNIEALTEEWDVLFLYFGPAKGPEYVRSCNTQHSTAQHSAQHRTALPADVPVHVRVCVVMCVVLCVMPVKRSFERVARFHQGKFAFARAETAREEADSKAREDAANAAAAAKDPKKKRAAERPPSKFKSLYAQYEVSETAESQPASAQVLWVSPYITPEVLGPNKKSAKSKRKANANADNDDDDDDEDGRAWTESALRSFVETHSLPLLTEMGPSNFEDLTGSGKLVVFAVTDPDSPDTNKYLKSVIQIAKQYRSHFAFGNIDGVKYNK